MYLKQLEITGELGTNSPVMGHQQRHINVEGITSFSFDLQTYVNLEVYDDKDYVNFDVLT